MRWGEGWRRGRQSDLAKEEKEEEDLLRRMRLDTKFLSSSQGRGRHGVID